MNARSQPGVEAIEKTVEFAAAERVTPTAPNSIAARDFSEKDPHSDHSDAAPEPDHDETSGNQSLAARGSAPSVIREEISSDLPWPHRVVVRQTPWTARRVDDPILPTQPVRIGTPDTVRHLRLRVREEVARELPLAARPPVGQVTVEVVGPDGIPVGTERLPLGAQPAARLISSRQGEPYAHLIAGAAGTTIVNWRTGVTMRWCIGIEPQAVLSSNPVDLEWRIAYNGESHVTIPPILTAEGGYELEVSLTGKDVVTGTRSLSLVDRRTGWAWTSVLGVSPE